jgi:hypothetical protein
MIKKAISTYIVIFVLFAAPPGRSVAAEPPSDETYFAFSPMLLALTNAGIKEFSCFGYQFEEVLGSTYSFAPITFSFNSKPVIFDVGYVRSEVPYTGSSVGVRIFGKGLLSFYGSFYSSYASKWDSYSYRSYSEMYGTEYYTRYRFSEISLSGGITIKYTYDEYLNTRFYVGLGSRLYEESGYKRQRSYFGFGEYEELDYFELDTKTKTVEISIRSLIGLYGPVKLFFSIDILTNPEENTEFIEVGRATGLIGVSYVI